jgi:tetratricopeptide (TPR) repeat protein
MKTLLTTILLAATLFSANAQTAGRLDFALPSHPGHLSLAQGAFQVDQLSAKTNGNEFGIKASDADLHLLAFLFFWPEQKQLTAATCRDLMLKSEGPMVVATARDQAMQTSASGAQIATVILAPATGSPSLRAFVASGSLCADILFSVHKPGATLPLDKIKSILTTLRFDPAAPVTFHDAFAYATVAFENHDLLGAEHAYRDALALVDTSDDPLKWRRICTDQLSMSYGMAGALQESRVINLEAIKRDPDYPIYYYSLACAEAENHNVADARLHLQQAFDRRANLLPGETMPDPAEDDSFTILMQDPDFAAFVATLTAPAAKP